MAVQALQIHQQKYQPQWLQENAKLKSEWNQVQHFLLSAIKDKSKVGLQDIH